MAQELIFKDKKAGIQALFYGVLVPLLSSRETDWGTVGAKNFSEYVSIMIGKKNRNFLLFSILNNCNEYESLKTVRQAYINSDEPIAFYEKVAKPFTCFVSQVLSDFYKNLFEVDNYGNQSVKKDKIGKFLLGVVREEVTVESPEETNEFVIIKGPGKLDKQFVELKGVLGEISLYLNNEKKGILMGMEYCFGNEDEGVQKKFKKIIDILTKALSKINTAQKYLKQAVQTMGEIGVTQWFYMRQISNCLIKIMNYIQKLEAQKKNAQKEGVQKKEVSLGTKYADSLEIHMKKFQKHYRGFFKNTIAAFLLKEISVNKTNDLEELRTGKTDISVMGAFMFCRAIKKKCHITIFSKEDKKQILYKWQNSLRSEQKEKEENSNTFTATCFGPKKWVVERPMLK